MHASASPFRGILLHYSRQSSSGSALTPSDACFCKSSRDAEIFGRLNPPSAQRPAAATGWVGDCNHQEHIKSYNKKQLLSRFASCQLWCPCPTLRFQTFLLVCVCVYTIDHVAHRSNFCEPDFFFFLWVLGVICDVVAMELEGWKSRRQELKARRASECMPHWHLQPKSISHHPSHFLGSFK